MADYGVKCVLPAIEADTRQWIAYNGSRLPAMDGDTKYIYYMDKWPLPAITVHGVEDNICKSLVTLSILTGPKD